MKHLITAAFFLFCSQAFAQFFSFTDESGKEHTIYLSESSKVEEISTGECVEATLCEPRYKRTTAGEELISYTLKAQMANSVGKSSLTKIKDFEVAQFIGANAKEAKTLEQCRSQGNQLEFEYSCI